MRQTKRKVYYLTTCFVLLFAYNKRDSVVYFKATIWYWMAKKSFRIYPYQDHSYSFFESVGHLYWMHCVACAQSTCNKFFYFLLFITRLCYLSSIIYFNYYYVILHFILLNVKRAKAETGYWTWFCSGQLFVSMSLGR